MPPKKTLKALESFGKFIDVLYNAFILNPPNHAKSIITYTHASKEGMRATLS